MDWWNLKAEHTPYEWAAQRAMYWVCPFGERRADMRAAFQTANLMAAQSPKEINASEFTEMVETLATYLTCDRQRESEEDVDLDALNMIKGKQ